MNPITKKKKETVIQTAILKIKSPEELDFIKNTFEEIISNEKHAIRIDIINGKSYAEESFDKNKNNMYKFFVEFFDTNYLEDVMSYLLEESNNFRVTDQEGTIVRPSKEDYDYVINQDRIKKERKLLIKYREQQEEDF